MFHRKEEPPADRPRNPSTLRCPFQKGRCCDLCHDCELWDKTIVVDTETRVAKEYWACSFKLHNKHQWDQGQALASLYEIVESQRQESTDRQDMHLEMMAHAMGDQGKRILRALADRYAIDRKRIKQLGSR